MIQKEKIRATVFWVCLVLIFMNMVRMLIDEDKTKEAPQQPVIEVPVTPTRSLPDGVTPTYGLPPGVVCWSSAGFKTVGLTCPQQAENAE